MEPVTLEPVTREPFIRELAARVRSMAAGDRHIFLGDPLGHAGDRTVVEPGNHTSPGMWTCGLSLWVNGGAGWRWAGDDAAATWRLDPPQVTASWRSGTVAVEHRLLFHRPAQADAGCDYHEIRLAGAARIALAVRGHGPAGSAIALPVWDAAAETLRVGAVVVHLPGATCELVPGDDPIAVLLVSLSQVSPAQVSPQPDILRVAVCHPSASQPVTNAWAAATQAWKLAVPARIEVPDVRVSRAWEVCSWHILAAMERGLPRIGVANYPGFWMRDGVLILRVLDLIGRHDLARIGCDWLAPIDFAGGFGAESDAPGEGAWALAGHAALSGDRAWLAANVQHLERRAAIIHNMRSTTVAMRAVGVERIPHYINDPRCDLLCGPSDQGLVRSRMDWHEPDLYCNAWCVAGLRAAASAAVAAAREDNAATWSREADELEAAIANRLLPNYGNDRDPACMPWPTGCLATDPRLAPAVSSWFATRRLNPDGTRLPETLWTYFEAAQAHNAMLCGQREAAWTSLSGMLDDDADTMAFGEGHSDGNEQLPFGRPRQARGWLDPATARHGNMPHNWTTAEILALVRDLLVREEGNADGTRTGTGTSTGLVLASGVPRAWLKPGAVIAVEGLPTTLGPVSYRLVVAADGRVTVDAHIPAGVRWRLDLPEGIPC